jgi:4-hydroxythreonine-4-phosphate dehydrogenase
MDESARRPLIITQGDPHGVGVELLLRASSEGLLVDGDRVLASPARLDAVSRTLNQPWARLGRERIDPLLDPTGDSAVEALVRGVDLVLEDGDRGLVTAPIDKAACLAEGFAYAGHTEYLAARAGVEAFCMAMLGPRLRVALATIHIPLREVPRRLTGEAIETAARLLAESLRDDFGFERPRVGVLGLNPHAGEQGVLGDEEQTVIEPAMRRLRTVDGVEFRGPLPADTAFAIHARGDLDGVVAMYHDQGLGPFKLMHFSDGVNATLGLGFVRTSPDHGTAKDIAGKGVADPSSMFAAIRLARGEGW